MSTARDETVPPARAGSGIIRLGRGEGNSSGLVNPGRLLAQSPTSEWSELARGTICPAGVIGRDKATCTRAMLAHFARYREPNVSLVLTGAT